MVVEFRAAKESIDSLPSKASPLFKAVGWLLPVTDGSIVTLYGDKWEPDKSGDGFTLHTTKYDERVPKDAFTVKSFLASLDGCDHTIATKIMSEVKSTDVLDTLDNNPGIFDRAIKTSYIASKVKDAYYLRRPSHRDTVFYLHNKFPWMDANIVKEVALSAETLDALLSDPFAFAISTSLSFRDAKEIAKENGVSSTSFSGIEAALVDVVNQSEGRTSGKLFASDAVGNTYVDVSDLREKAASELEMNPYDPQFNQAIASLVGKHIFTCPQGKYVYRKQTSDAEYGIADEIHRLLSANIQPPDETELKYDIYSVENQQRMRLAPEQRAAVKTALSNTITLLIGGPGTGKTTIEKVILSVYRMHSTEPAVLIAPTGKAARRMSESTGEPASTGHKALNVTADCEVINSNVIFDAGIILIDEASMLDSQLFHALLKATRVGTQIVIVGDTNQLPSIGSGNVLFELIESGKIAVARLETVYRQKAGSTIAVNCARIKSGRTSLEYEDGIFEKVLTSSQEEAEEAILSAYQQELDSGLSVDDICVLTPYRRTTLTGTNQLNQKIQKMVIREGTPFLKYGDRKFYVGDKIISSVNENDVANGDIGFITCIDGSNFRVDFGNDRIVQYKKNDLRNFELAYSITIHRSQGSEYKTCIIVVTDEHKKMLKRNLIYTAVSRAKSKVILVGQDSALSTSILTEEVTKRKSRLAALIQANETF